jgi:hypothetical protein
MRAQMVVSQLLRWTSTPSPSRFPVSCLTRNLDQEIGSQIARCMQTAERASWRYQIIGEHNSYALLRSIRVPWRTFGNYQVLSSSGE